VDQSLFSYPVRVPGDETRTLILDTDAATTGGHGRIDYSFNYPVDGEGIMRIYCPSRSGLVFAKLGA
jgi:hypothetical protein